MFIVEDQRHAEWMGQFASLEEAVAELRRFAAIPWDKPPNIAPCAGWSTCGREYEIIRYDDSSSPWKEIGRMAALEVSAEGVKWAVEIGGAAEPS